MKRLFLILFLFLNPLQSSVLALDYELGGGVWFAEFSGEFSNPRGPEKIDLGEKNETYVTLNGVVEQNDFKAKLEIISKPGDDFYLNPDLTYKIFANEENYFGAFVGGRFFWYEREKSDSFSKGLILGGEGEYHFHPQISIYGKVGYVPYFDIEIEREKDIDWDGNGYQLEFLIKGEVVENLILEAGYRYWNYDGEMGIYNINLIDTDITLQGAIINLTYRF